MRTADSDLKVVAWGNLTLRPARIPRYHATCSGHKEARRTACPTAIHTQRSFLPTASNPQTLSLFHMSTSAGPHWGKYGKWAGNAGVQPHFSSLLLGQLNHVGYLARAFLCAPSKTQTQETCFKPAKGNILSAKQRKSNPCVSSKPSFGRQL